MDYYVPLTSESHVEFIKMLDSIPLSALEERSDLERRAKLILLVDFMYASDDTIREDYAVRLLVGNMFIYGCEDLNDKNPEELVCACQAHGVLFPEGHKVINMTDQNKQDIKFIQACIKDAGVTVKDILKNAQGILD